MARLYGVPQREPPGVVLDLAEALPGQPRGELAYPPLSGDTSQASS